MFGRGRPATEYLTVVTYGRTGSTAIQSALNTLPGVLIRGENYGAIRGLHAYVQSIAETADRHHAGRPTHPWFGSARLSVAEVVASLRAHVVDTVLRPSRETRVLGFKEIRYEPGHFADADAMLDYLIFLDKLFPGMRYLMNVRDAESVARSGWWPQHADPVEVLVRTRERLEWATAELNRFFGTRRAWCIDYEQWNGRPEVLIDLFIDMGLPRNDDGVRAALADRLAHGPHGRPGG